jgi:hypothetical protein
MSVGMVLALTHSALSANRIQRCQFFWRQLHSGSIQQVAYLLDRSRTSNGSRAACYLHMFVMRISPDV